MDKKDSTATAAKIGEKIKLVRRQLGATQFEIAEKAGMNTNYYARIGARRCYGYRRGAPENRSCPWREVIGYIAVLDGRSYGETRGFN